MGPNTSTVPGPDWSIVSGESVNWVVMMFSLAFLWAKSEVIMSVDNELISVVIPTFNSEKTLKKCLESIRLEFPLPHEIVVVDDDRTTDGTLELCSMYGVHVVVDPAGMAESRNIGAAHCTGEFVLHLDSDMEVPPGLREALISELNSSHADGLVISERAVGDGRWIRARQLDKSVVSQTGIGESVRLIRRTTMKELAGYDATLLAGEDADFTMRLRAANVKISKVTSLPIIHNEGRITLYEVARKKYRYGKTLKAYEVKNGSLYSKGEVRTRIICGMKCSWHDNWLTAVRYFILKTTEFSAGALGRAAAGFAGKRNVGVAHEDSAHETLVSLVSIHGPTPTGGDLLVLRLIRAMASQGIPVRVVTTKDQLDQGEWISAIDSGALVDVLKSPEGRMAGQLYSYFYRTLRILFERQNRLAKPQRLLIGSVFMPDLAMLIANYKVAQIFITWQLEIPNPLGKSMRRRIKSLPLIEQGDVLLRTSFSYFWQMVTLKLAARNEYYMVVTNESLEAACLARGISPSHIIRGDYGVDLEMGNSRSFEQRTIDFLFLGRLHSQKGLVDLLSAWRLICIEVPEARLVVVGDGDGHFADWCKHEMRRLGSSIDYRGPLAGDEKWSLIRDCKVLLFTSTYESFGIVALEGMAAGAAVVGYDTEVSRKAFGDGMFLVPFHDVEALATAAVTCLIDSQVWERQHQAGLATAAKYDWNTAAISLADKILAMCDPSDEEPLHGL